MASDFEDLFADMGAAPLTDFHGETVTQYPLGVRTNGIPLSNVIVDLSEQGHQPIDTLDGVRWERRGKLTLSTAVSVTVDERAQQRDTFLVRGQIWIATGICSQDTALQIVVIERSEAVSTKRTRLR